MTTNGPTTNGPTTTSPIIDPAADESDRYRDALRYLYERINYERLAGSGTTLYPFRLQRVAELMRLLHLQDYLYADSPRPKVPLVHIAGTKGKGSVATMVAAGLTACGFRTGLYTSPHLHRLEERFRIDGTPCTPAELVSLVQRVESAVKELERTSGAPSFFELTTAMAMLHFEASRCDAIVIEVGLGGRLDSTNVLAPTVSVVTSIGLDHQHVLGHDLPTIAGEKAGIIKPGIPVISGVADHSAAEVIEQRANDNQSQLFWLGRDFTYDSKPLPDWGCQVEYRGQTPPLRPQASWELSMEGEHQGRNAAIAMAALDVLRDRLAADTSPTPSASPTPVASSIPLASSAPTWTTPRETTSMQRSLPPAAIEGALMQLQCEARLEHAWLEPDVLAIVDAAHNEDSINALCRCVQHRSANRPVIVVFGTSLDKSADTMLKSLAAIATRLILTRYQGNPRYRPPGAMTSLVPAPLQSETLVIEDPIEACGRGLQLATPGGTLVICGSFFLAAETRPWMLQQPRDSRRDRAITEHGSQTLG